MKYQGKITRWNDTKGFGFIVRNGEPATSTFVHISACKTAQWRPVNGDSVSYQLQQQSDGKIAATEVFLSASQGSKLRSNNKTTSRINGQANGRIASGEYAAGTISKTPGIDKSSQPTCLPLTMIIAAVFLLSLGCAALWGRISPFLALAYLLLSAITFITYWRDKLAAQAGRWRISESTLHLCSLLGGWPGAIAAQYSLRHKTQKTAFKVLFYLTVIANLCALAGYLY